MHKNNKNFLEKITIKLFVAFIGLILLANIHHYNQPVYFIIFVFLLAMVIYLKLGWKTIIFLLALWTIYLLLLVLIDSTWNIKTFVQLIKFKNINFFWLRIKTINFVETVYKNKETSAYINMLLFNHKNDVAYDIINKITNLSINHLFVISGLHINIFILILEKTFFKKIKHTKYFVIIVLIICGLYLYFLAFSISILRIFLTYSFKLFMKNASNLKNTLLSGITIIFLFKNEAASFGFLMSYFCVIFIINLSSIIKNKFILSLLINFGCILITFPFVLTMNKKINVFAFFHNYMFSFIVLIQYFWIQFSFLLPFFNLINTKVVHFVLEFIEINNKLAIFFTVKWWNHFLNCFYYLFLLVINQLILIKSAKNYWIK